MISSRVAMYWWLLQYVTWQLRHLPVHLLTAVTRHQNGRQPCVGHRVFRGTLPCLETGIVLSICDGKFLLRLGRVAKPSLVEWLP